MDSELIPRHVTMGLKVITWDVNKIVQGNFKVGIAKEVP